MAESQPSPPSQPSSSPRWRVPLLARFRTRGDRGRLGERLAVRHFRRAGYRILARNVRMRAGEVDLIVRRRDVLAFVEVRTRQPSAPLTPEQSVDARKQATLVTTANEWLMRRLTPQMRRKLYIRFDIVAIDLDDALFVHRFTHYERAFDPPRDKN